MHVSKGESTQRKRAAATTKILLQGSVIEVCESCMPIHPTALC